MRYETIHHISGDDYDSAIAELYEVPEGFSERGYVDAEPGKLCDHLAQWDYGDGGEISECAPGGLHYDVYHVGEYVLAVNFMLQSATLARETNEGEE